MNEFLQNFGNIDLSIPIIIVTAIVFLFFHRHSQNKLLKIISIILGFIPVLIHEIGHAVTTTVTGGKVKNIYMVLTPKGQEETQSQGYALSLPKNRMSAIAITFMGYIFPPAMFMTGVFLVYHDLSLIFILILVLFTLYYFWHTSQKWIPIILFFILGYTIYGIFTQSIELNFSWYTVHFLYNFILGLVLGEIIQSIITTTQIQFTKNGQEWDGKSLKRMTLIPSIVWFMIWTTVGLASIYFSFSLVFID